MSVRVSRFSFLVSACVTALMVRDRLTRPVRQLWFPTPDRISPPMMNLDSLLLKAERYGSAYTRDLYFRDCWLDKGILYVPDRATGEMIGRAYGADMKRIITDLRIVVQAKPEASVTRPSAFKKGYAPQRLLDS